MRRGLSRRLNGIKRRNGVAEGLTPRGSLEIGPRKQEGIMMGRCGIVVLRRGRPRTALCRPRKSGVASLSGLAVPRAAIVRGVPDSFAGALSMTKPAAPIDVELARRQHAAYVDVLRRLVREEVVEVPADNAFPDCPFVEDTAVVIGSRALITRPGAPSRRGEVTAVKDALKMLGITISEARDPASIDGGDVLFAGGMLFVGMSKRTNEAGIEALASTFEDIPIVPIVVPHSLHLKTVLSEIGRGGLAVESGAEAESMFKEVQARARSPFERVRVSPAGAANTLLIGRTLVYPSALCGPASYGRFARHAVPVDISEFHKADGGLTCLSIFIH